MMDEFTKSIQEEVLYFFVNDIVLVDEIRMVLMRS